MLFDLPRVFDFMASFIFGRKVNRNGQVTLKGHHYTVGLAHKEKTIQVRLDPKTREWLFLERDAQDQDCELSRRPLVGLDWIGYAGELAPSATYPTHAATRRLT